MAKVLPLPKLHHPSFNSPGKFPLFHEIDWSSSQARRLVLAYSGNDPEPGMRELTGRGVRATAATGTPTKIFLPDPMVWAGSYTTSSADEETGLQGLPQIDFSLSFWINTPASGNGYIEIGDNTANNRYLIYHSGGLTVWQSPTGGNVFTGGALSANTTTFCVFTFKDGEINYYVDGVFSTSGTPSLTTASGIDTISFGDRNTGSFSGDCDLFDVRVYDGILDAAEVWAMYNPQTRWDLFKPINEPYYFVPEVAVGGQSKPPFKNQYNYPNMTTLLTR